MKHSADFFRDEVRCGFCIPTAIKQAWAVTLDVLKESDPFVIHDYERQDNHRLFLARVVNNARICFEEDYLSSHYNFPWLAGGRYFLKRLSV